jgi:two-component system nitrate/nitrite response regulator NarL
MSNCSALVSRGEFHPLKRRQQLTESAPFGRRSTSIGSEPTSSRAVRHTAFDVKGGFSETLDFRRPIDVAVAMHPILFGEVLSQALCRLSGLRVVSCQPGKEGVSRIRELGPRVLVLDEEDVERNGRFLRQLGRGGGATRILVMVGRSSRAKRENLVRRGAFGVVEKGTGLEGLARAIQAAASGKIWTSRSAVAPGSALEEAVLSNLSLFATDGRLTKREWEVAERVGCGLRNREIALRLNITQETVKSHLNNIFRKLQIDGRIALGILARSRIVPKKDA